MVPLELQLGKVCLMLVLRPQAEVFISIFPLFLKVICSLAHSLSSNGQLVQTQRLRGWERQVKWAAAALQKLDTSQRDLPQVL